MFMGTLQGPYLEKMIDNVSSVFYDIMIIAEWLESNLKNGNLQGTTGIISGVKEPCSNFQNK